MLEQNQRHVLHGIVVGAVCTVAALAGAAAWHPEALLPGNNTVERVELVLEWSLLPAVCLLAAIARLARHRFFSLEDIDGGISSAGTPKAQVMQACLQNTLEQTVLAVLAWLVWAVAVPNEWMASIPAAACLFVIGRLLFFHGYERGAGARALGFALTFYPSIALIAVSAVMLGYRIIAV